MPDEIVRPSRPDDIPELIRLFEEVFGAERPADVWQWKYFDNPRGCFSHVVEAEGRLVAHCGGTPIVMRDGVRRYLALQSVDFMSSRRYAGGLGRGGVFARMVDAFFELHCRRGAVEMVYGFPGERHRLLGERILKYASIEPVGELTLSPGGGAGEAPLEPLPRDLALLSQAWPVFGGARDETYLEWRYRRHPRHLYESVVLRSWPWRRPKAVAILRAVGTELMLMEILGDLEPRQAEELVRALRATGKLVVGWGSLEHVVSRRLLAAGFAGSERPHRLEVRYFNDRRIPSAGELYYSLGDYDVY